MNRVPVESYLAGVIGGELGPRRADERQAMLAQAVVSRTFALKNRGRWNRKGSTPGPMCGTRSNRHRGRNGRGVGRPPGYPRGGAPL